MLEYVNYSHYSQVNIKISGDYYMLTVMFRYLYIINTIIKLSCAYYGGKNWIIIALLVVVDQQQDQDLSASELFTYLSTRG